MNMSNGTADTELANRIVALVEEHWGHHETPLLLSQLGSLENGEITTLAKQESGGLKAYLQDHLIDRVRIIQHSSNFTIVGAIPAHVRLDDNVSIDKLFFRTPRPQAKHVAHYYPAVWAAFKRPLEETKKRYLKTTTPIHYVDVLAAEKPDGFVEIGRESLADLNADSVEIEKKIIMWAEENNMEISVLQSKRRVPGTQFPSNDMLSRLLASLGEEDLRRVSMPLDIVYKLRREQL